MYPIADGFRVFWKFWSDISNHVGHEDPSKRRGGARRHDLSCTPEHVGLTAMDAPIHGVSLERYAELSAEVTDCVNDPGACARTVEALGVSRTDWEAAHQGWIARMHRSIRRSRSRTR